jgi:hypothetical protein
MGNGRARYWRGATNLVGLLPVLIILLTGNSVSKSLVASETRAFRMQSRDGFLKGTLDGIGIDSLGTMRLADRVERLAGVELVLATRAGSCW